MNVRVVKAVVFAYVSALAGIVPATTSDAQSYYPVINCCVCPQPVQQTTYYAPQQSYQTAWRQVPVTSYQSMTTTDAWGYPVTYLQPVTTMQWQAEQVSHNVQRPVFPSNVNQTNEVYAPRFTWGPLSGGGDHSMELAGVRGTVNQLQARVNQLELLRENDEESRKQLNRQILALRRELSNFQSPSR